MTQELIKYDPTVHGRQSQTRGTPKHRLQWEIAGKTPPLGPVQVMHPITGDIVAKQPVWVPWESVWVDDSINPRENGHVDAETVATYANQIDILPPINVQRDTFRMIGGKHRLQAHADRGHELVPVVEWDIPDEEMADAAFLDNSRGLLPLTQKERVKAAQGYMKRHPAQSDSHIAQVCGVHRNSVRAWKQAAERPERDVTDAEAKAAQKANKLPRLTDEPSLNGKGWRVTERQRSPIAVVDAERGRVLGSDEGAKAYHMIAERLDAVIDLKEDACVQLLRPQDMAQVMELVEQVESWCQRFAALAAPHLQRVGV